MAERSGELTELELQIDGRLRRATSGRTFESIDPTTGEAWARIAAASVIPVREEAEALANDSDYGLAAGVWKTDVKRAHRLARNLEAGTVWVNTYRAGGYEASGIGWANGVEAVGELLQTTSVWVELSEDVQDPSTLRA